MSLGAEILAIGEELVQGKVVDTNSAWLATQQPPPLQTLGGREYLCSNSVFSSHCVFTLVSLHSSIAECQELCLAQYTGPCTGFDTALCPATGPTQVLFHRPVQ